MQAVRLAGPGMIHHTPYEGTDPHGMQLETFYSTATVDGHEGDLIVKRNYGPEGVNPHRLTWAASPDVPDKAGARATACRPRRRRQTDRSTGTGRLTHPRRGRPQRNAC
ncbi:hypothetical protein [Maritimibacter sp. HL-12]|uniref:hypothetical protein n=1 Tax=Maritimibacter sp. HL-12 TaxID=1162418 RepID=UPI000A0F1BBA|nr:hypothetical protein [Maritimibacter sp. HL-12]SMH38817.1 hypothetical protein SAMN05661107_0923 [Maritimibacter sp. HL-12]